MLKLRTVFPYGLNHDAGKFEHGDNVVGIDFPKLSSTVNHNNHHGRNYRRNNNNVFNVIVFYNNLKHLLNSDVRNVPNFLRITIPALKKSHLKALRSHFMQTVLEPSNGHDPFEQYYLMAVDIIETKLYKPYPEKTKRKPPKYKLNIPFSSKAFDYINLPHVLRSDACTDVFPECLVEDDIPMVVFKLMPPIRSKILNYTK